VLSGADAVDAANHAIFLYSGTYANGITLNTGEKLVGQGTTGSATFDLLFGISPPTGTIARPAVATGTATVQNTVTLASTVTLRGLALSTGINTALTGSGGLTNIDVAQTSVTTTTGTAVSLNNAAGSYSFSSISTNGAANGILLDTLGTSSFTASGGSIVNASTRGVDINGGTGNFTYSGTISTSGTGRSVEVTGHTGGTVTLSGAVTDTGSGINLGSNTGATITFSGGIAASTGTNAAFTATGGGTVNVTGTNTLATTTGTALNVANTTIGASGLTFRSIASNGAASGVILNTTGSSGGLTVTGNAGTCTSAATCTGGAIQNSTGSGISLTSVGGGANLTRMFINDSLDDGIRGTTVNGFTLSNATVTSNGDTAMTGGVHGDHGVDFTDLTGTATFTSSNVSNNIDSNVVVSNGSGTLNMTVTGGTYSGATGGMGDAIFVEGTGSGNQNLNVQGPITLANNVGDAVQHSSLPTTTDSDVTINNATISSPPTTGNGLCANNILGGGITVSEGGPTSGAGSNFDVTITNNNIQNSCIGGIAVGTTGSVVNQQIVNVDVTIQNNIIGQTGAAGSGSIQGNGIFVDSNGNSNVRALITGNQVRQWTNRNGLALDVLDGDAAMDATVRNNVFTEPFSAFAGTTTRGMTLQLGSAQAGDSVDVCLDIGHASDNALKNQVFGTGESPQPDIRYLHEGPGSVVHLVGYSGPTAPAIADIVSYLQPRNNLGGTPTVSGLGSGSGSTTTNVASCPLPAP
jgi:large repetitive protein